VDPSRLSAGTATLAEACAAARLSTSGPDRGRAHTRIDAAGVATPRPEPARSVSTLSASRVVLTGASRANQGRRVRHPPELPPSRPGLFHPGNAHELPPSGLCSLRRSRPVSRPDPPLPLGAAETAPSASEVCSLRRGGTNRPRPDRTVCPPGVLPSEALPLAAVAPASRPLLSRAYPAAPCAPANRCPEDDEAHLRVSPCGERGCARLQELKPNVPAPLGFPTSSFPAPPRAPAASELPTSRPAERPPKETPTEARTPWREERFGGRS
jgi:hypothetical protein